MTTHHGKMSHMIVVAISGPLCLPCDATFGAALMPCVSASASPKETSCPLHGPQNGNRSQHRQQDGDDRLGQWNMGPRCMIDFLLVVPPTLHMQHG